MRSKQHRLNSLIVVVITVIMTALMSIALFSGARKQLLPEAYAQDATPSLQERQVRALEKIANEMSRMRRGKCN